MKKNKGKSMKKNNIFSDGIETLLEWKRSWTNHTGWFLWQEIRMNVREEFRARGLDPDDGKLQGDILCEGLKRLPLSIPRGSALAGTQDDAFSPSYALINPAFQVETFAGYCDPVAIYDDIRPSKEISAERIAHVRGYYSNTKFVRELSKVYEKTGAMTQEVAFFVEPVTGHIIPDLRPVLAKGIRGLGSVPEADFIRRAMEGAVILAHRYAELAEKLCSERAGDPAECDRLKRIAENCRRVPESGAQNLHQALQSAALMWQCMCLEQAPNPYAFSVGNLDRMLEPYLKDTPADEAAALVRHFLAFLMVGRRCWAISQNIMVGGRDEKGNDLSCRMTQIVLDAFFLSNNPQPALSVKVHSGTPEKLYRSLGRFFFTPGHSTPSLFNDDMMFRILEGKGIAEADRKDYSIAGCQEPLIMGKESGNTTNSWLNLGKVLELTLHDGKSAISGKKLGLGWKELGYDSCDAVLDDLETAFLRELDFILKNMEQAANGCTRAIAHQGAPFTSSLMGGLETGRDVRDETNPGCRYRASGCLVHGLSVAADSILAVRNYRRFRIGTSEELLSALKNNFKDADKIAQFLRNQPKYGCNLDEPDLIAVRLQKDVCGRIAKLRNPSGAPFLSDFSTPSTHLLYGYHVGATPDGRMARTSLGYGIDPRPEAEIGGYRNRLLSERKLDYSLFNGGYASHLGLSPELFRQCSGTPAKMKCFETRVIRSLFRFMETSLKNAPYYVYFNIDSAVSLRKVLADPKKYAPTGIYIMRIHGTFVNFLDLSPAIQQDIIKRLEPEEQPIGA